MEDNIDLEQYGTEKKNIPNNLEHRQIILYTKNA
jgi:hypothetical protein